MHEAEIDDAVAAADVGDLAAGDIRPSSRRNPSTSSGAHS